MKPGKITGCNMIFGPPPGEEDNVQPLETRVDREASTITSAWYPSKGELAMLNQGHPVSVSIYGAGMPPIYVGVEDDVIAENNQRN